MKRFRVILLFLLLGAIVNVVVTWGFATWVIPTGGSKLSTWEAKPGLNFASEWTVSRYDTFGVTQLIAMAVKLGEEYEPAELEEMLPSWSGLVFQMDEVAEKARREAAKPKNSNSQGGRLTAVMQHAFGFPFRGMYWNFEHTLGQGNLQDSFSDCINIKPRPTNSGAISVTEQRALPLGVIPLGFALNTVISGLLMWLLMTGLFALRRFSRRRRGLCVKCAYDLRGADHESCPECGEEIRKGNPA